MPIIFGVEVGNDEEVDCDWDGQLIDNTTGKKVFDLGHQYVPPEQLFPSFKDGPCLLSCANCATVMRVEELVQVKREFYPRLDVHDVFSNMENEYRSEIVPFCYTCTQRLAVMFETACPPLPSTEAEVNGDPMSSMSQANNWTAVDVKEEENEMVNNAEGVQMKSHQDFALTEKIPNLNDGLIDSGVEMEDSDTCGEQMEDSDTCGEQMEDSDTSGEQMEDSDTSGEQMEDEDTEKSDTSCREVENKKTADSDVESSVETYTCNICDSEFQTAVEFGKHTRTHERISATICPVCSIQLSNDKFYEHLEMHGRKIERLLKDMKKINRKESVKKLKLKKCSECSWAFHSRSELKKHKRETHFKCVFCNKYFKDEKRCKKHVLKGKCDKYRPRRRKPSPVTSQNEFMCTTCQKSLPSQEDLSSHLKMHLKFKKCKICFSKVRSGAHFQSHMRQHEIAAKENPVGSSMTTAPQEFVDETVSSGNTAERNTSLPATSEQQVQEDNIDMPATRTTWRQLSLQLKNKDSPVKENGTNDISRNDAPISNVCDKSKTAHLTNTTVGSIIPIRSNSLVRNSSCDSFTNIRQRSVHTNTQHTKMENATERIGKKCKKASSSEKENRNQLSEPQEQFVLEKKFSLKNNTKRIYFKRSPEILAQLANKQLKHTEIHVKERVQSCTP
ncbi:zinc finger protein 507-like isoform X2 [Pecten maximus]|uniref:zinc finger protein 507-like isoform X2 n=1 Tax=Pecten maximus TaxID=6579 RepID=UPI001457E773|nr:zinc finger protein 507-like isoform X2 [Pecten maximus]